ncbi:hypothetical protein [Aeromicrobium sp. Root495]|uniref:hypothetical protein n=1 Tax=Aeromicrobium sp. Root495 TaxID=1736550 RepID=UPI0012E8FCF9|nr:hypothetical protein [Aeromicrobium sp. Root495]
MDDPSKLPAWTRRPDPRVDTVLRALVKTGSPDGHDDPAATSALCWLLLPGATNIARSMSDLGPEVDDLVAVHLWLAARTFDWSNKRTVAGAVLRETRRSVQAELGIGRGSERSDRTWHQSLVLAPDAQAWHVAADAGDRSPEVDLLEVFRHGIESGNATSEDCQLLLDLAVASTAESSSGRRTIRSGRSRGGLCGTYALDQVARSQNVSARTVSRRAGRIIDELRDAASA